MTEKLKMLLIEDNPADTRLVRKLLADSSHAPITLTSCTSLDSGLAYLAKSHFDLVLSDLTLPDSYGLDTVSAILRRFPAVPIVVLTSMSDRQIAEQAIHIGAQDHLSKHGLSSEVLERTLAYAVERSRVQEALRTSERQFHSIFDASPLAISIAKIHGKGIIAANQAFYDLLGYGEADLARLTLARITHPDDLEAELEGVDAVSRGDQQTFVREKRLIREDGNVIWVKAMGAVFQEKDGRPQQILVIQQDITAEKALALKLDSERRRLTSVMETMPAFLYLQARDHTIPFANSRFSEYFGSPEGKRCHQIFHHCDTPCTPCNTLSVLQTRKERIREWTDDRGRVFELRARPYDTPEGEEFVLVIGTEITDLIHATQALRISEQRFRELAEMLPEIVFECNLEGRLSYVNQAALERFGYSREALERGISVFDMVSSENRQSVRESVERLLDGGSSRGTQYVAVRSNGSTFPVIIRASVITEGGTATGLRGIVVDITERVAAEQALAENESKMRAVLDSVPDLLFQLDQDDRILTYHAPEEQLYVSPEAFLGKRFVDVLPEEAGSKLSEGLAALRHSGTPQQVEYSLLLHGQRKDFEARLLLGSANLPLAIIRDISERKQAQDALEMADNIIRSTPVGMFIYRFEEPDQLILVDANPEAEKLTGILLSKWRNREFNAIWPGAKEAGLSDAYLSAFKNNTLFSTDDLAYKDNNVTGNYRIRAFRVPGNRLVVSFEDISEQLTAQHKLQESEQRYRSIVESSPVGILTVTSKGRIASVNRAFLTMTRYPAEELVGKHFTKIPAMHIRDLPRYVHAFRTILTGKAPEPFEASWTTKDGQIHHGEVQVALMKGSDRDWQAQVIVQDVTERHDAQAALLRSEAEYRSLFENAVLGIYRTTPDGRILAANDALVRMLGYESFEQLAARNLEQEGFASQSVRSVFKERLERTGQIEGAESSWIRRDGTVIATREHANVVRDGDGTIIYYEGTIENITEQKVAELQLHESETTQQGILDASPIGIGLIRDGNFQWVSDRVCEMCGYSADELLGQSPLLTAPDPAEFQRIECDMDIEMARAGVADTVTQWKRKDGSLFDVNLRFASLDPADPEKGAIFTLLDITERKRMEESLHLTQYSIDSTNVIILWLRASGDVVFANNAACRLLGYSQTELLEKNAWDITPDYPLEQREELWSTLKRAGVETSETLILRRDGTTFPAELTAQFLDFQGTEYEFVFAVDISERKAAEAALHESEENYRTIFNSASDAIMLYDASSGQLLDANERIQDMFGYPVHEFLTLPVSGFSADEPEYSQEEALKRIHAAAGGKPQIFEWHAKKKSGDCFWIEVSLRSVTLLGNSVVLAIVRDISERKTLEARLRQSQKLESIGTLASGVAHEINNPLMGIINYAELIDTRIQDPTLKQFAEGIKEEGDRVAKIVRNLLSFSRQDQEQHSAARMRDIVDASLSLIGSLLQRDAIQISVDVPEDLPTIRCRSQQIQQVLINLVTNARDSLNAKLLENCENKDLRISSYLMHDAGGTWLRTTIEDCGMGIPDDVAPRIFDPFFTTKARNEGTGLGLSISYGIVRDHGGHLTVESEPGRFTRFHIDLPVPEDLN